MTVPQLDHQVFTPGPARDYAAHAIEIAKMYPDYGKMLMEQQNAAVQRQAAIQKYQNDAIKAQAFLEMYPEMKAAQIAKLRAQTAQSQAIADTTPGLRDAQIAKMRAITAGYGPADESVAKRITGGGFQPPALGAEDTDTAVKGEPVVTPEPSAGVDTDTY